MSQFHSNMVVASRQLVVALQKLWKCIRDVCLLIVRPALAGRGKWGGGTWIIRQSVAGPTWRGKSQCGVFDKMDTKHSTRSGSHRSF